MSRAEKIKSRQNKLVHSRTEPRKDPRKKIGPGLFLFLVLLTSSVYLIFFSGLLKIKNIEIRGYSHPEIIREIVRNEIENDFFSNNILTFNAIKLRRKLAGDSRIKNVKLFKKYPNSLCVEIEEATGEIIWISAGDKFLISNGGVVVERAENEKLPTVYDSANIPIKPGDRVASPTFINFIKTVNSSFEVLTGEKITKIIIFDLISDIHIMAQSGWSVYFNTGKDPETQLKNLARVLDEARVSGHTKLQYIDMRIEDRIFYK